MEREELHDLLERLWDRYDREEFISADPIAVPHCFASRDDRGVDFGLWRTIPPSALYLPLDLHTGNMGRALGLLARRQNDWRAVEEITAALRTFDADDPVRYDFALFGAGIDGFLK